MKKFRVLISLFALFGLLSCSQEASSQVNNLGLEDFVKTYKSTPNAQLLDVRTPGEWAQGKIGSSALVNFNDPNFSKNIEKLDKTKPVFVYCAVGGRSARASQILSKAGFKVYNLTSAGYSQLAAKGLK